MSPIQPAGQRLVRLFLLAGEASGDKIGADLIARLHKICRLELHGVGGEAMREAGMHSLFPMSNLSVMGVSDVLKSLPLLLWRLYQTERAIIRIKPDIVVLVDSQEFSTLLAKRLKKRGFAQPILLYVAPTVWVYKPERAQKLKKLFDEVLAVLPFEPEIMKRLDGPPTSFVGHPAQNDSSEPIPAATDIGGNWLALLPGSRMGELKRHLPLLGRVAKELHARFPEIKFFLPTLAHLEEYLRKQVRDWEVPVEIVVDSEVRKSLFQQTRLAVVVSGTATLELAFSSVPMVVTYVMDLGQRRASRKLDFKYISLPNIILDENLLPELLLETADPLAVLEATQKLLTNPDDRQRQIDGFVRMAALMAKGTKACPRQNPADRVLSHLA